jgi:hypothetical protein
MGRTSARVACRIGKTPANLTDRAPGNHLSTGSSDSSAADPDNAGLHIQPSGGGRGGRLP